MPVPRHSRFAAYRSTLTGIDGFLNWGAAASALCVTAHVVLSNTAEWFSHGAEAGTVIYDLALAYLASWIFYAAVVVVPRYQDARRLFAALAPTLRWIAGTGERLVSEPFKRAGIPLESIDEQHIHAAFSPLLLRDPAPLVDIKGNTLDWALYMREAHDRLKWHLSFATPHLTRFDVELSSVLAHISGSEFIRTLDQCLFLDRDLRFLATNDTTMDFFAPSAWQLVQLCARLQLYIERRVDPIAPC